MKIYLLDDNRIIKYALPSKVEEDYVIHYKTKEGESAIITICADNNNWNVKSNGEVHIIKNNAIVSNINITLYDCICLKIYSSMVYLCVMPMFDNNLSLVGYNEGMFKEINIGKGTNCNIKYNNEFIDDVQTTFIYNDNKYYIRANNKEKCKTYLNDSVVNTDEIKYGDVIFINGLSITWMKNFFIMNNPKNMVEISGFTDYTINRMNNENMGTREIPNARIYSLEQVFYHIPRLRNISGESEVKIDPPPEKKENDDIPVLLSLGTSVTMLGSSAVMIFSIYNGVVENKPLIEIMPQIIMVSALVVGSVFMPRILQSYKKRRNKKNEIKAAKKYKSYLATKEELINNLIKEKTTIIFENNPSAKECYDRVVNTPQNMLNKVLWNREIEDDDFLNVRLGIGNIDSEIKINAPEEKFTIEDNPLLEMVYKLKEQSKIISNVPVTYSFAINNITSLIFDCKFKRKYINSIIMQLISNHSGNDLKIVVLTSSNNEKKWDYLMSIPHLWDENKNIRFFGANQEEYLSISSYLMDEYRKRNDLTKEKKEQEEDSIYKNYYPYYLIISDDYQCVKNLPIISNIIDSKINYGFSLLTISDNMKELPNRCEWFIEFSDKVSFITRREFSVKDKLEFNNEYLDNVNLSIAMKRISNIPLLGNNGSLKFPNTITFLEMMGVSKIEQLNITNRWEVNNPVLSLATVIGVNANQEEFKIDLHEKFYGPHGLIAGSTGSGKSEFIMTFILSMAINYHPYEVQFVLIDYKGGGLAGAFENKETGVKLPHLVETITNLDTSEMNRTIVSLRSELKRRQKIFNEVRDLIGEGTIDIYKYQRLYREGTIKEPMSHLFIISDEFAELKSQQPEFMGELISISRIGRSLGVHLILATQKPSGVVDDQIWSNSRFKICFKVQNKEDSNEMLKRPDAASIKDVGRFFLQVGYDDYFEEGQSGWAGALYIPTDTIVKRVDDSINFINNIGYSIKNINNMINKDVNTSSGDQLSNIVKYIYNISLKENIITKKLWLDNISSEIYIEKLKQKYNYKSIRNYINPIIGEFDNPSEQIQSILNLDLTNEGNVLIYGKTGSGTEELVKTVVWSLFTEYSVNEVNIYIIDCGSETLQIFNNVPHIGKIANSNDEETIKDILKFAENEIEYRKDKFVNYGGNYINYIKSDNTLPEPLMVFIINGFDNFNDLYEKYIDNLIPIFRESPKYGIKFIVTATSSSSLRYKVSQSFDNLLTLQLNDESEYRMILGSERGMVPSNCLGRGLCKKEKNVFEFQTAFICPVNSFNDYVFKVIEYLRNSYKEIAKQVPSIPKIVKPEILSKYFNDLYNIPIGYDIKTKDVCYIELKKSYFSIISCDDISEKISFIDAICKLLNGPNTYIFDFQNIILNKYNNIIQSDFDNVLPKLKELFENDKNQTINKLFIFIGLSPLNPELKEIYINYANVLNNVINYNHNKILLISNTKDYGEYKIDKWYRNNVNKKNGLWIGTGIESQNVIENNVLSYEDNKIDFKDIGYLVKNSKYKIVKLISEDDNNG